MSEQVTDVGTAQTQAQSAEEQLIQTNGPSTDQFTDLSEQRMPQSARIQHTQSVQAFEFEKEDLAAGDRIHTEGDQSEDIDTLSVFSESVVEKEGVSNPTKLIIPEDDDDEFFAVQSQQSARNDVSRRGYAVRRKSSANQEEQKSFKINEMLQSKSQINAAAQSDLGQSEVSYQNLAAEESKGPSKPHRRGSAEIKDKVHVGSQDSKFAMMFQEGMKNFRIRQFAADRASPAFGLMDPSLLNGKYVVYKVQGRDALGVFEGNRRYNEFFLLRQVIVANWPGIYIPSTPSKKLVGNKDVQFIIERRYFLERFILQLSQIPSLVESTEFQTFMRPATAPGHQGEVPDIEKLLKDIQQEPPSRILSKYKEAFDLSDEDIDAKSSSNSRIQADTFLAQFDEFLKKMLLHYKDIKKKVIHLLELKSEQMNYSKNIFMQLGKYEERNFAYISDRPEMTVKALQRMIVGGQQNELMRDFLRTSEILSNPFQSVFYWIKGQVSDIKAMRDALVSRDNILQVIQKIKTKKASVQKELDSSVSGRATLRNFFKTGNEKQTYNQQLQRQIAQLLSTEKSYSKLSVIIDDHLVKHSAIFKKNKIEDFTAIVREIAQIEVENSNQQANFWSRVLSDPKLSQAQGETTSVNIPV